MAQHLSNDERKRIIDAFNLGTTQTEIARIFGLKKTRVHKIISIYLKEGRTNKKASGGLRRRTLNTEHKKALKNYMNIDCSISLREMKSKLKAQFDIDVSIKTIDRTILDFNWSYKSVSLIPARRNDEDVIQRRLSYANEVFPMLTEDNGKNIYFLDEVGFNVVMRTKKGRSRVGTRATHVVPGLRSKNISCCCAMSKEGIFHFEAQEVPYNTSNFIEFLKTFLKKTEKNKKIIAVIIMDNVPFYKSLSIKTLIVFSGHRILYLPPYSPFLNRKI
ncbi:hypothetical protein CDIK_4373 [Cucumispora dikerogammari]|nr:hypothetical protein CDIK_4373 [Cucumispora dikerogammari]